MGHQAKHANAIYYGNLHVYLEFPIAPPQTIEKRQTRRRRKTWADRPFEIFRKLRGIIYDLNEALISEKKRLGYWY